MQAKKNIIIGLSGPVLTQSEIQIIQEHQPVGFILFARNCVSVQQVKDLTSELKRLVSDPLILIDQEGGRVNRLRAFNASSEWPAGEFGRLAVQNIEEAQRAVYMNHQIIAADLYELGVNVDCAPVVDLQMPGAHQVIGDRSFARDPAMVVELASIAIKGLQDGGIIPVIKHIPGHGRAMVDSHHELPVVDTDLAILEGSDFIPFRQLNEAPMAMTAHVIYTSLDAKNPVTTSKTAIQYIRNNLGYQGLLVSDDVNMQALTGSIGERALAAMDAGCDLILQCSGKIEDIEDVVAVARPLSAEVNGNITALLRDTSTVPALSAEDRDEVYQALQSIMLQLLEAVV